jgi:probable HAF family extracellular repeat protein
MDTTTRATPGTRRRTGLRFPARLGVAAVAAGTVAGALLAAGPALAAAAPHAAATNYTFTTLDNQADPTFNQLLGINTHNVIAGYFGIGGSVHPNKGYLLDPPYAQSNYVNENFPGSAQTQVTGIDNKGNTCGFWVTAGGTNHGFVEWNGVFASYNDPNTPHVKGSVNQLLGINNNGVAVGFYTDAANHNHAYEVNQATGVFTAIKIPGDVTTQATGINNNGDIVGWGTDSSGNTTSWLLHDGHLTTYQHPNGGTNTQAFGVNDHDEVVGTYMDSSGMSHGFTLKSPLGPVSHWQTIDDPSAMAGTTVVNGLNDAGDLVGFYTDTASNVDGMLATP